MEPPRTLIQPLLGPDFRPCAAPTRKLPDSVRVVVTGDSYAYGLGVRASDALPAQLGARFATTAGAEIEVLNLGCPGLSLYSGQAQVHQLLDLVELDLLLLVLSSDDTMPWLREHAARLGLDWNALWNLRWNPAGEVLAPALAALDAIRRAVLARGGRLAVAYYDPVGATGRRAVATIGDACRASAVAFIDLVTPFACFEPDRLVVSAVDAHPSAFAHRIAAAEVEPVIRPLLPARAPSHEQPAVFADRLAALDAAHASLSTVLEHALACSELDLELRSSLAGRYQRVLCAAWRCERLHGVEPELGRLSAVLAQLERQIVLTTLGVRGFAGTQALAEPLSALKAAAEQAAEAARESANAAPDRDAAQAGVTAGMTAASAIAARIEAQRIELERRVQASLAGVRALCGAALLLAERQGAALASEEALRLASEAAQALAALRDACAEPPEGQGLELAVDGAVAVDPDVTCAMLSATFVTSFPGRHEFQQLNYLRLDGRALRCAFDLPPGTVGRFSLKLSLWRGADETVVAGEPGLRRRIVGSDAMHACPDDLLIVPHQAPRQQCGP